MTIKHIAEAHGKMFALEYVGGRSNEVQQVRVVCVILLLISLLVSSVMVFA